MLCCSDDAVLVAPSVTRRWGRRQHTLRGKSALREHFTRRLAASADLALAQQALFVGPCGYALLYRRENGTLTLEAVELDLDDMAVRVSVFGEAALG